MGHQGQQTFFFLYAERNLWCSVYEFITKPCKTFAMPDFEESTFFRAQKNAVVCGANLCVCVCVEQTCVCVWSRLVNVCVGEEGGRIVSVCMCLLLLVLLSHKSQICPIITAVLSLMQPTLTDINLKFISSKAVESSRFCTDLSRSAQTLFI